MRIIPIISPLKPNMDDLPGQTVSDTITMSDGAEVPNNPKAIRQYNEMRKQSEERTRQQYNQQQRAKETGRFCPFHPDAHVNPNTPCKKDCALYANDGCSLAARPGKVDTANKPCPFRRHCTASCALYRGAGCSLTNTATAEKG